MILHAWSGTGLCLITPLLPRAPLLLPWCIQKPFDPAKCNTTPIFFFFIPMFPGSPLSIWCAGLLKYSALTSPSYYLRIQWWGSYFERQAMQATNFFTLEEVEVQQSYQREKSWVWFTKAIEEVVLCKKIFELTMYVIRNYNKILQKVSTSYT